MKPLSLSKLRQMASERDLRLDEEDLARLRPMVEDLLAVGRHLRREGHEERPRPRPR
jgi:hypothetical protein